MDDKNLTPLASEMYADLKETNRFLRRLLIGSLAVIAVLVIALAGTNIYHILSMEPIRHIHCGQR